MNTITPGNQGDNLGLNEEDLKQFGIFAEETPEEQQAKQQKEVFTKDEVQALIEKNRRDNEQQISLMQDRLLAQRQPAVESPQSQSMTPINTKIPIAVDEKNMPYVDTTQMAPMFQQAFNEYHNNVMKPHEDLINDLTKQRQLNEAVDIIKQRDPSLLEGQNAQDMAGLALGLYNSPTNPGRTDTEKSNYVFQKLGEYKLKPGNPSVQGRQASNQVGRTEGGPETNLAFDKGKTITIYRTTPSEMGLDAFMQSVDYERNLQEQNDQYKMGWKINVKRPDHLQ